MLKVFWALVLVLVAAPCVAEPRDSDAWAAQRQPLWTVGGHAKYRFLFQTWPADSLLRDILGSTSSDHFFETRLKLAASRNRWDFQADYQFIAAHADTLQLAGQLPGSFFATGEIANDDRRWWDLTYSFDDGDRSAVVHRLDRLSVGFTTERAALRFGRQAVSWGNGMVFTPMDVFNPFDPAAVDDLDVLAELVRDSNCLLVSDEVYEHIVFDGEPHRSLLGHGELYERSFVISSFGKTVHATGWKLGYCAAPPRLAEEFRKVHQFTTFAVSTPMQLGIADYLSDNPSWCEELPAFYERKRDHFCRLLEASRFRLLPTRSTFFQVVDYSEISDETDAELAVRWTHDIGVASIPLSVFCEQPFTGSRLRFCFAKDDATLEEAARRLSAI